MLCIMLALGSFVPSSNAVQPSSHSGTSWQNIAFFSSGLAFGCALIGWLSHRSFKRELNDLNDQVDTNYIRQCEYRKKILVSASLTRNQIKELFEICRAQSTDITELQAKVAARISIQDLQTAKVDQRKTNFFYGWLQKININLGR